jgi:PPOX class probable F420-dependent enzyme
VHLDRETALRHAASADHGVLATLERARGADLVPVCFAMAGGFVAVPIDSVKPKGSTALGRIRNLERDPRATLLTERWDPGDWTRLWWVRMSLRRLPAPEAVAASLIEGLRARYAQYRDAPFTEVLTFRIEQVAGWAASAAASGPSETAR